MEVVQLFDSQGFWQHQVLRGMGVKIVGNKVLWKGMATSIGQYTPVFLSGELPSLTEKPDRLQSQFSSVQFSSSVVSDSLRPRRLCDVPWWLRG